MSLPRYGAYKESYIKWLGEVPAHWNIRRLGYFFSERREKVSDKEFQPLSVTKNGVVPQLETAAKTDDGDNRKLVRTGDFVINSRSDRKGSSGRSTQDGSVSLINTVLVPTNEVCVRFAHHLLRSVPFQEEYYRFGKGIVADLWSTNYSEMRNIALAVPKYEEQQEIAKFLDRETAKIDALIAEQEALLTLLAEKRQATISHAVTRGLDPTVRMKDSGIAWLGEVPAHWEVCPLKSMVDPKRPVMYGIVLPGPDVGEGIPILKGGNVKPSRMNLESMARTTAEIEAPYARARLVAGDLVYAIRGTIGDCEPVPDFMEGANITQDVARVAVANSDHPGWVRWALLSSPVREELAVGSLGAAVRGVNIIDLKRVKIPRPPLVEQKAIAEAISARVSVFDQLSQEAKSVIELLQERRSALIAAAVTGKIDVCGLVEAQAA